MTPAAPGLPISLRYIPASAVALRRDFLGRQSLHNFPCKIVCRDPVSGRAAPRAANPVGDRAPQRQQFFPLHRVMPDLNDFVVIADAVR